MKCRLCGWEPQASQDYNYRLEACRPCADGIYAENDEECERANRAMDTAARLRDSGKRATYCHSGF